jgi:tRNA threonylcarbamoyladenosine biosynthesis protein TsaE
MEQFVIKSLADWDGLATHLVTQVTTRQDLSAAAVVVLTGDLGAGKTTFTQALAKILGVQEAVQSPTFSIMKLYGTERTDIQTLIHMDAYRIESLDELRPLRFAELLTKSHTLICIEWGERIEAALPSHTLITINHQQDDLRLVTIEAR